MKNGAFDFIEKPYNEQKLLYRINDAIEHDRRTRRESAERDEAIARMALLTPREREVIDLIVEGLGNKQIAARLEISGPGFCDEEMHIFLATGLVAGQPDPDEDEQIELVPVPLAHVSGMIRHGEIRDGKSIAALLLAVQMDGSGDPTVL